MPSARTHRIMDARSSSNRCAAKELCRLRSDNTEGLRDPVGFCGFGLKRLETRDVRVPLDERRQRPKTFHRRGVQTPYGVADVCVVRIDENFALLDTSYCMARQVKFLDNGPRDPIQIAVGIKSMIHRVDVNVVDVE